MTCTPDGDDQQRTWLHNVMNVLTAGVAGQASCVHPAWRRPGWLARPDQLTAGAADTAGSLGVAASAQRRIPLGGPARPDWQFVGLNDDPVVLPHDRTQPSGRQVQIVKVANDRHPCRALRAGICDPPAHEPCLAARRHKNRDRAAAPPAVPEPERTSLSV